MKAKLNKFMSRGSRSKITSMHESMESLPSATSYYGSSHAMKAARKKKFTSNSLQNLSKSTNFSNRSNTLLLKTIDDKREHIL